MAHLCPLLKQRFFDEDGDPLAGGKLYSYEAGTSTPQATYTDQSEGTSNPNPVILDANGEANVWIGSDPYKFVLTDANDVTIFTVDNVTFLGPDDVDTINIKNGAVTTPKIADGAVTQKKLAAKTVVTAPITIGTINSTTPATQTGTATIATTGRPVRFGLKGTDNAGVPAFFKIVAPAGQEAVGQIEVFRDATRILSQSFGIKSAPGPALLFEELAAGSYTWTPTRSGTVILTGAGGGGGGGGGVTSNGGGGAGGAGGECGTRAIEVTAGLTYDIEVGAGGTGGNFGTGGTGGDTTISQGGTLIAKWKGGLGGTGGTTGAGPGGTGGTGYKSGGDGGNGGSGSPGTGATGFPGTDAIGGYGEAGVNQASIPSGGNGGGGGGGGGSLGKGGNGQRNDFNAGSNGERGGGGGGAAGSSNSNQVGYVGGDGVLQIFDGGAGTGGTIEARFPVSAIQVIDTSVNEATHNYTIKLSVSDADATLTASGIVSAEVYEL